MQQSQEQFLNDVKTKIRQYVYRSIEQYQDPLTMFLQEISGNGNLNWHKLENKTKLISIFTRIATAISNYALTHGDFRTYVVLHMTDIICDEFATELFRKYVGEGYGVAPESVVGSLADAYTLAPPQNTDFPGQHTTANPINPEPAGKRLISQTLYSVPGRDL